MYMLLVNNSPVTFLRSRGAAPNVVQQRWPVKKGIAGSVRQGKFLSKTVFDNEGLHAGHVTCRLLVLSGLTIDNLPPLGCAAQIIRSADN